jgi:hypothetical protein
LLGRAGGELDAPRKSADSALRFLRTAAVSESEEAMAEEENGRRRVELAKS